MLFTKAGAVAKAAEWVAAGAGVAHRWYDGVEYRVVNGALFKGKTEVPTDDQVYRAAFNGAGLRDGVYVLVGPGINGNPGAFERPTLLRFDETEVLPDVPRTRDALREYLRGRDIEGVIWVHEDGRTAHVAKADLE